MLAVREVTDRYLRLVEDAAIGGETIQRHEAVQIVDVLRGAEHRRVLASGVAGCGKSGVLGQAIQQLRQEGWPVLAFRLDRLTPTPLPKGVGGQLELPGSPAQVLAAVAGDHDSLLVIDQLDAVSKASGRNPQFLECIGEIIDQAAQHPRLRVVLACRDFDLQNDDRLRRLLAEPNKAKRVGIGMLTAEVVRDVVARAGLNAGALTERQIELLSLPLHLSLLWQVADGRQPNLRVPDTVRDLYDAYWSEKQSRLAATASGQVAWNQVVDALCGYMSNSQQLSAPESTIDDYLLYAQAMASEHVITIRDRRVQFFHESFFDYAFARRFAACGGNIHQLLLSGEQQLFRRAQVRQILTYERAENTGRYLTDLRALLTDAQIRFHIKRAVCDVLAQLSEPMEGEWQILSEALASTPSPMAQAAWSVLVRSAAWFGLLDRLGVVQQWLDSPDDTQVDRAVMLLNSVQRTESARVATLLTPYVGRSKRWAQRFAYLLRFGDVDGSRAFLDLFLRSLDAGLLDDLRAPLAQNADFWMLLHRPAERHPDWTCEIIGHYLQRRLALSLAADQPNPFDDAGGTIPSYGFAEDVLKRCSSGSPSRFVREVLPFMLKVMELTASDREPLRQDAVWRFRRRGAPYDTERQLLSAVEGALRLLAERSPQMLSELATEFSLESSPFETVHFLLVRAYSANGMAFSDHAIAYLCEEPARFTAGYMDGEHGMYWASRELLQAVTPHCSAASLQRIEECILGFYPPWERRADMRTHFGHAQLVLLDAIDAGRRSPKATRQLMQWQRKFDTTQVTAPEHPHAGPVPSPIAESSAERMTDEHWLSAIKEYDGDHVGVRRKGESGELVGGAWQLSGVLEGLASRDPARFSRFLGEIPDEANPTYFAGVLRGLAKASPTLEQIIIACRRCHALSTRSASIGAAIVDLIGTLVGAQVPGELLDMLSWHATDDPDPEKELWRTATSTGDVYYGGDPAMAGLNSVRGDAARIIAAFLYQDSELAQRFRPALERMVQDRTIAVRTQVAEALTPLLNWNRDVAVDLFLRLCDTEDVLLGTHFVEGFLHYALFTHLDRLLPIIERMLASDDARAAEAGARRACVAALYVEGAQDLLERCLVGSEAQRVGAAQILGANLGRADFRAVCEEGLGRLFDDASEKVQEAAAGCFREIMGPDLADFSKLALRFTESQAYQRHYHQLAFALGESPTVPPELICNACERFLDIAGSEAGDVTQGAAFEASTFSELVLRAYASATERDVISRCLDMIDRLLEAAAYGIDKPLQEYDR